jgi:serine/threonine-protein kinase
MRAWYGARRAMRLEIGQIYGDKYRIIRRIGEGAMGAVYEGENVRIHRRVAIKTLHGGVASKAEVVTRFEREAQAAGRIGSEHIVEVLDMGELEDGTRFMVMEFLEGVTLAKRIRSKGRLSPDEACVFLIELLDGLAGAHQAGIIHRDLKPANVFLLHSKNGRADFVKILDFGVSKFSLLGGEEMAMTSTGAVLGTPFYMSPEQAKGSAAIDHRSDLYTVGVIAYECVTGQVPYAAETFNELLFKIVLESPPPAESFVPDLDPGFAAILRKAMAREPGDRYQTAAELSKAFSDFLARPKGAGQAPRIAAAVPTPPPAAVQAMGPGGGLGPNGAPPAPQVADRPAGFGGAAVGRAPAPRPAAGMPAPAMQGGGMHGTMAMPDGMPGMAPQGPNAGALPTPPPAPAAYPYGGGQSTVALATGPTLQAGAAARDDAARDRRAGALRDGARRVPPGSTARRAAAPGRARVVGPERPHRGAARPLGHGRDPRRAPREPRGRRRAPHRRGRARRRNRGGAPLAHRPGHGEGAGRGRRRRERIGRRRRRERLRRREGRRQRLRRDRVRPAQRSSGGRHHAERDGERRRARERRAHRDADARGRDQRLRVHEAHADTAARPGHGHDRDAEGRGHGRAEERPHDLERALSHPARTPHDAVGARRTARPFSLRVVHPRAKICG